MALEKVSKGLHESSHFRMHSPLLKQKTVLYIVEARTPEGLAHLPTPTAHLPNPQARALIARLEQTILHGTPEPPHLGALPLETPDDLVAFRNACFPGLSITGGRSRLAGALGMSVGHIKQMEEGRRRLHPRTATLLRMYARQLGYKRRYAMKTEAKALEPFTDLYEAMADPREPVEA